MWKMVCVPRVQVILVGVGRRVGEAREENEVHCRGDALLGTLNIVLCRSWD
jgi:hypothetical protein